VPVLGITWRGAAWRFNNAALLAVVPVIQRHSASPSRVRATHTNDVLEAIITKHVPKKYWRKKA